MAAATTLLPACSSKPTQPRAVYSLSGELRLLGTLTTAEGEVTGTHFISNPTGARVYLSQRGTIIDSTTTRSGQYVFRGLLPGTYRACAFVTPVHPDSTAPAIIQDRDVVLNDTLVLHPAGLVSYPNPFREAVSIRFDSPTIAHAFLRILSLDLSPLAVLADRDIPAGHHQVSWDGRLEGGSAPPPGPYWAVLTLTPTVPGSMGPLVGDPDSSRITTARIGGAAFMGSDEPQGVALSNTWIFAADGSRQLQFGADMGFGSADTLGPQTFLRTPTGDYSLSEGGHGSFALSEFDDARIAGSVDVTFIKPAAAETVRFVGTFEADPAVPGSLRLTGTVNDGPFESDSGYEYFPRRGVRVYARDRAFVAHLGGRHIHGAWIEIAVQNITGQVTGRHTLRPMGGFASATLWTQEVGSNRGRFDAISGWIEVTTVGQRGLHEGAFEFTARNPSGAEMTVTEGKVRLEPSAGVGPTIHGHDLVWKDGSARRGP